MISAVVPAYNEEATIAATVHAIRAIAGVVEVLVVDDGSTDRTMQAARQSGAEIIRLERNLGKGAALNCGMARARGEILLFLDADLGETAREAEHLLQPLLRGEADMAIATFPKAAGRGGGFGFVVRLARKGIHERTGRWMEAPLSGQRALRRAVLEKCAPLAEGFGVEVALTIDALRGGFTVVEVPTNMRHRVTGRDLRGFAHRFKQYLAVARVLRARPVR